MQDHEALREIAIAGPKRAKAMQMLFDRHHSRLVKHVRFSFPDLPLADVEDLVAHGFLRLFERADSFRGECSLASWLTTLTRNLVLDHLRHLGVIGMVSEHESHEAASVFACALAPGTPLDLLQDAAMERCVRERFAAFSRLHPQAATALWERFCNEASPQEMARVFGKSAGAMRQYLSEWAGRLRQHLAVCVELLGKD